MDFSDREVPYPCLEIVENKQHSRSKVLTLKVHPLVIGAFPLVRKLLDNSHHIPKWTSTKTKDVIDNFSGKVRTEKVLLLKSSTHQMLLPPSLFSPHRFSRQFGYCQDVPGALIEQHYDGSLLALVQLWDSCVRLGSSLKIFIPMRPSNKGSLITHEYSDW
ncbi:hypothetical protein R3W88_034192 [Solanum pinnatisectum]|uniref:Uncharacterized protein n=1 Tax=Solanum pinnatisectum TaxID=50273 RepID=A0AAV9JZ50_9SOLN|nr:hypothetical protein R3W88_034192 [Solanum pinnatisectum]